MSKLYLSVITPERTLFEEEVKEVILPVKTGQITVLPNHVPLVAEISPGEIIVRSKDDERIALLYGGFVHIKEGSKVIVLADAAEHIHELNEAEVLGAKKAAEKALAEAIANKELFAESEAELIRIAAQLKAITKHSGIKRKHGQKARELND